MLRSESKVDTHIYVDGCTADRSVVGRFVFTHGNICTDEEVEAATYAHGSKDMPERNIVEDIKFAQEIINKNRNSLEVVKALAQGGFTDVAQDMLNMQKAKLTGDYLHTSAIIVDDGQVLSAVNDINDYAGPATGYRLQGERWEEIKNIPGALDPNEID